MVLAEHVLEPYLSCDIEGGGGLGWLPGLRHRCGCVLSCWSNVIPDQGASKPQLKFSVLPAHLALLHLLKPYSVEGRSSLPRIKLAISHWFHKVGEHEGPDVLVLHLHDLDVSGHEQRDDFEGLVLLGRFAICRVDMHMWPIYLL